MVWSTQPILAVTVLLMLIGITTVDAFVEGIYCGTENCYEVLGVNRESTTQEITKAYRKMAKKWHPDMHRSADAKEAASQRFLKIGAAYETLTDPEGRKEYDYMLDNPEEVYRHYYYYFRRRYSPKVDVRIVLVVTISVISGFQYYGAWSRYNEAIDYFMTVPKYKTQAVSMAKEEGLIGDRKRQRGRTKEEIRAEEDAIIRQIIEDKMDIRGGYSKPTYKDVLWIQLLMLPWTLWVWALFYGRWFIKFTIMKEPYGDDEKAYLMRRYMKLSQAQWDALEDDEQSDYFDQELWIKDNFTEWKQKRDDEMKAKLAESASYKRYRRWMKKGGPGQITFADD